jgi:hypothetical protein
MEATKETIPHCFVDNQRIKKSQMFLKKHCSRDDDFAHLGKKGFYFTHIGSIVAGF